MILAKPKNLVEYQVENELILVPVVDNVARMEYMFVLNETALYIWNNLENFSEMEDLVAAFCTEFEIDEYNATVDINDFLSELKLLTELGL